MAFVNPSPSSHTRLYRQSGWNHLLAVLDAHTPFFEMAAQRGKAQTAIVIRFVVVQEFLACFMVKLFSPKTFGVEFELANINDAILIIQVIVELHLWTHGMHRLFKSFGVEEMSKFDVWGVFMIHFLTKSRVCLASWMRSRYEYCSSSCHRPADACEYLLPNTSNPADDSMAF